LPSCLGDFPGVKFFKGEISMRNVCFWWVSISIQHYKSVHIAVMTWAILVNTHTHTLTLSHTDTIPQLKNGRKLLNFQAGAAAQCQNFGPRLRSLKY